VGVRGGKGVWQEFSRSPDRVEAGTLHRKCDSAHRRFIAVAAGIDSAPALMQTGSL
jgi:hypothetical protein